MAGQGETWSLIESDPGVFTELIEQMGVRGVQVEELYALDAELLHQLRPIYGLVFLFKWQQEQDERIPESNYHGKVFFANQVITNACATQAILSILLNRTDLQLGSELTQLRDFTADFPPEMKGLAISNCESIRQAHNSFAPPQPMLVEDMGDKDDDKEAYHFISYVHVAGALYELDGLKAGPIKLAECGEADWLSAVCPIIAQRIEKYSQSEIRFNLMAVIRNRKDQLNEQLHSVEQKLAQADGSQQAALVQEQARIQEELAAEAQKRANWRDENVRRKHNYIPFIFNFLKALAEKDKLQSLIDIAGKAPHQS